MNIFQVKLSKVSSFKLMIPLILYRVCIDIVYFYCISPRHSYTGMIISSSFSKLWFSWLILIAFYCLFARISLCNGEKNSNIIVSILFLASFVPFTSCIYVGVINNGFIVYNCIYWLVIFLGMIYLNKSKTRPLPKIKIDNNLVNEKLVYYIGFASILFVIYLSYKYAGFRLNFNLYEVYDIRLEAREYNFSAVSSYFFLWTKQVIPILLGLCLLQKKYTLAIFLFFIQMLNFGIDGLKSTFFMPFLVAGAVLLYKIYNIRNIQPIIFWSICLLSIFSGIEFFFLNTSYISDLGIRRLLYVPNLLGEYYFDFFNSHPPDFFRSSFLRHIGFQSPYTENGIKGFTYWIGDIYFGKPAMNCNNGLSSDALANFGVIGCIVSPVILVAFLNIFDKSTINVEKSIAITPIIYLSYNLISTTLTTVLVSHGGFLIILMMILIGNQKTHQVAKNSS